MRRLNLSTRTSDGLTRCARRRSMTVRPAADGGQASVMSSIIELFWAVVVLLLQFWVVPKLLAEVAAAMAPAMILVLFLVLVLGVLVLLSPATAAE